MRRLDVQIPAPDGHSNGTLHVPDGDGPWPGVLVFPDAGGTRETFRQMGDRLASMGYVALIPDIYYRAGHWAPFDVTTVFTDSPERARLAEMAENDILVTRRTFADMGGAVWYDSYNELLKRIQLFADRPAVGLPSLEGDAHK